MSTGAAALGAMAVLAACGLLPCIGAMRADLRAWRSRPRMTTAEAEAAIEAHFAPVADRLEAMTGAMRAAGYLPDRRSRPYLVRAPIHQPPKEGTP